MIRSPGGSIAIAAAGDGHAAAVAQALLERLRHRQVPERVVALPLPARWSRPGIDRLAAGQGVGALALVASPDDPCATDLRRAPPVTPALRVFFAAEDDRTAVDRLAREVSGWIRGVAVRLPLGPQHLRPRFTFGAAAVSRRDLLTVVTGVRHDLVPAVEADRCAGTERCGLCIEPCPHGAIVRRAGQAAVDPRRCTGCGACVVACPVDAIRLPGGTKEEVDACLRDMLAGRADDPAPGIVAFTCARWNGTLPAPYLECPLPCVGLLSPWAILRAIDLGAGGIAVITGDSPCRDRHDPGRLERDARVARELLRGLGREADRIAVADAASPRRLQELAAALGPPGAPPGRVDPGDGPTSLALGALLAGMVRSTGGAGTESRRSPEIPLASVEVDPARCSLCGLCALCPSGAIAHREDAERSVLTFHYAACTGCGLCRKVCPEQAIRLTPGLVPARLADPPRPLLETRLVRCESCGSPIAPGAMLDAIARRLGQRRGPLAVLEDISRLCPACRLSVPLGEDGVPRDGRLRDAGRAGAFPSR